MFQFPHTSFYSLYTHGPSHNQKIIRRLFFDFVDNVRINNIFQVIHNNFQRGWILNNFN